MTSNEGHILLTGPPGIGKTTLIIKICKKLVEKGLKVAGFYTEEVREQGRRIGFDVVSLNGQRGPLARIYTDRPSSFCVGKYHVDLDSFESVAITALKQDQCDVLVIDEIGKMELFSRNFQAVVQDVFRRKKGKILATIPLKSIPLVEELKKRTDVTVYVVSEKNRNELVNIFTENASKQS